MQSDKSAIIGYYPMGLRKVVSRLLQHSCQIKIKRNIEQNTVLKDHSKKKMLRSFSKLENEVQPAVIAAMIFSKDFCRLNLQAAQYL